jgi:RNA polymerase sigma-70 factor (ECF subfamily)
MLSRLRATGVTARLDLEQLAEEKRLVEAAQREPRRFDQIYERYFNRIYAFAVARTADRQEAEDVTSETFQRAVQGLPAFEWREVPLGAWLFRIAANVATDLVHRRRDRVGEDIGEAATAQQQWTFEDHSVLFDLVDRLPPAQRQVIFSRFIVDRSVRDTAACLGRSEGAVNQLQRRALQQLRAWLVHADA